MSNMHTFCLNAVVFALCAADNAISPHDATEKAKSLLASDAVSVNPSTGEVRVLDLYEVQQASPNLYAAHVRSAFPVLGEHATDEQRAQRAYDRERALTPTKRRVEESASAAAAYAGNADAKVEQGSPERDADGRFSPKAPEAAPKLTLSEELAAIPQLDASADDDQRTARAYAIEQTFLKHAKG